MRPVGSAITSRGAASTPKRRARSSNVIVSTAKPAAVALARYPAAVGSPPRAATSTIRSRVPASGPRRNRCAKIASEQRQPAYSTCSVDQGAAARETEDVEDDGKGPTAAGLPPAVVVRGGTAFAAAAGGAIHRPN